MDFVQKFRRIKTVKGFKVRPKNVQRLRTASGLQSVLLKQARLSNVVTSSDPEQKLVLLKLDVTADEIETARERLREHDLEADVEEFELELGYEHMNADEALRAILPENVEVPTSFETVGHLAHFNLKEASLPYKKEIGQVILDKNSNIRTVVTKIGTLENEFRTFAMEVIAGIDSTECTVKENGMTFVFDFRKVYWNGKLSFERERLLAKLDPPAILIDPFAGVGAFACFAARKGVQVFANDLNPDAVDALRNNAKMNDVKIETFNLDARKFLRMMLAETPTQDVHIVMNLPEAALDFLDVFQDSDLRYPNVRIHCHCFARTTPPSIEIHPRLEKALGSVPTNEIVYVRTVAPNKNMYCVEFTLETDQKRRRIDC